MCGISCFFSRDSFPNINHLAKFLNSGKKRGSDGFGLSMIDCKTNKSESVILYDSIFTEEELSNMIIDYKYNLFITNHRAAPETEQPVSKDKLKESLQPICRKDFGITLVHNGAISNFIISELKKEYNFKTEIDSEAIAIAYHKFNRNIVETVKYLSGGFSFIMYDHIKNKLYVSCSHNPLYCGYVRGCGLFFNSMEEPVWNLISDIKDIDVRRNGINIWEDYYAHEVPAHKVIEIDLDSGMMNEFSFEPRYIHPKMDLYLKKNNNRSCVFVASSGGLDSSTTLAVLKKADMNPQAVHVKYGHRGQDSELLAIEKITEILDIPLYVFDIQNIMNEIDNFSMLTNPNHEILTGTDAGLKTTVAWTCLRNVYFMTLMTSLAESNIIQDNIDCAYLTGGFMNLTESGVYPDNSERFVNSYLDMCKFGSICGNRIKPLYGLCNILKSEQYVLLDKMNLLNKLSPWLISCDRPKVIDNIPCNCSIVDSSGKAVPACGSGLLSFWASKIAGVPYNRSSYLVDDPNYKPYENDDLVIKEFDFDKILDKIEIPKSNLEILKSNLSGELNEI